MTLTALKLMGEVKALNHLLVRLGKLNQQVLGKLKLVRMQVDLVLASLLLLLPLPSIASGAPSAAIYYGTRTSGSPTGPR